MPRSLRFFAWASFVAQVTIIATGGAVRLTGSGLGCPTWPTCTPESLVPTDVELTCPRGHGYIVVATDGGGLALEDD